MPPPSCSLSTPWHHLCLPVTCCAGSGQRKGAEVWLRGHLSQPPTQAAVPQAHRSPCPTPLSWKAQPLPWVHGLPRESTLFCQLSQETSSSSVCHGVLDPSPTPEDRPGSHSRLQLRLALHGARPQGARERVTQGFTPRPGCLPAPPPGRSSPSIPQGRVPRPHPPCRHVAPPQVSYPPPWQRGRQGVGPAGTLNKGDAPRPVMGPPNFSSQAHLPSPGTPFSIPLADILGRTSEGQVDTGPAGVSLPGPPHRASWSQTFGGCSP